MSGFFSSSSWQSKEDRQPTIPRCGACKLYQQCISPKMEVTGDGERKILFVAEAPGEEEDRQGTQLVGKSGKKLRRVLRGLQVDLDDCWKTNAVICHPPENKMESRYIEACRANLLNTVKELKPKVIILLGKGAVDSLIPPLWKKDMGTLGRWVGWTIPVAEHRAWVCPTYHPSFLLRSDEDPVLERMFEDHLERAIELENEPAVFLTAKHLQDRVEVITEERLIRARLRGLLKATGRLAFDYETTGLKPEREGQRIVSCSFCYEGEDTFAFPWIGERVPKLVSRILRSNNTIKIASNLKFEERWTKAKLGHGIASWGWDTMLAAHQMDNRQGISSVKFQTFIHLGVPDFSSHLSGYMKSSTANGLNRIQDIELEDLLIYNGMDSLVEFLVMERQQELMGWAA